MFISSAELHTYVWKCTLTSTLLAGAGSLAHPFRTARTSQSLVISWYTFTNVQDLLHLSHSLFVLVNQALTSRSRWRGANFLPRGSPFH